MFWTRDHRMKGGRRSKLFKSNDNSPTKNIINHLMSHTSRLLGALVAQHLFIVIFTKFILIDFNIINELSKINYLEDCASGTKFSCFNINFALKNIWRVFENNLRIHKTIPLEIFKIPYKFRWFFSVSLFLFLSLSHWLTKMGKNQYKLIQKS